MGWRILITQLYSLAILKLSIGKTNLSMSGDNEAHMRDMKIPLKKKSNHLLQTFLSKQNTFIDLNDLLKYI
jgi:hypothetical protein